MTVHRLSALMKHWTESPPVHIAVAAYLGIGKGSARTPRAEPTSVEPPRGPADFMQSFPMVNRG